MSGPAGRRDTVEIASTAATGSTKVTTVTSRIANTTFDCLDAYTLSMFWAKVLGFSEDPRNPNEPGDDECLILSADRTQRTLFIEVPEVKSHKNRVHLDLTPVEGTLQRELDRLLSLGARTVADRRRPDGSGWVVLVDPEDNEFCIVRDPGDLDLT